jgi:hypothetical protein
VAVGGTDLTANGAGGPWQSETAWIDSSGGPADDGFAIPSWQTGIANSSNQGSTTIRNVPDVAAVRELPSRNDRESFDDKRNPPQSTTYFPKLA